MEFEISRVRTPDLAAILELNEAEVRGLGPADAKLMRWFVDNAAYFGVARHEQRLAAFLIGLRPGSSYPSPNYRWFCERYDDFAYIDRVVVVPSYRRHQLASRLYADFAASLPKSVVVMTCEVNIKPPNEGSLRFHVGLGFEQMGMLASDNGNKEVAMMVRQMSP